jgi:hypothetical protein
MKTNVSLEDYKKIISATKTLSTPLLKIAYIVTDNIIAFFAGVFVLCLTAGLLLIALVIVIPQKVIKFIRRR